jgi:uncharacterized membrane protein
MNTRPATQGRDERDGGGDGAALSSALGWFGIGLGVAEVLAPGGVARLIGVPATDRNLGVMRAMGVREITSGLGILAQPRSPGWVWSRTAGDVMDLTLLQRALSSRDGHRDRTAAATMAVLGVAALDVVAGERATRRRWDSTRRVAPRPRKEEGIHVRKSITVDMPRDEVYDFWRDFENFPRFMRHVESVRDLGDGRSHWKATAPAGMSVEWDAEIVDDRPGERIAWRSVEGSEVSNYGAVTFRDAPGDRGTELLVELRYDPPGGVVTNALATLFRKAPGQQIHDDLGAFKQMMETGEVLVSDATARPGPHPGQPIGR